MKFDEYAVNAPKKAFKTSFEVMKKMIRNHLVTNLTEMTQTIV